MSFGKKNTPTPDHESANVFPGLSLYILGNGILSTKMKRYYQGSTGFPYFLENQYIFFSALETIKRVHSFKLYWREK